MNGPCFIKFGQWAATRRDIFPPEFCDNCKRLHAGANVHTMDHTHKMLENDFGIYWKDELEIESEPLGSGCVGQVYKGVLKRSPPEVVAVKVLHPKIRQKFKMDIEAMRYLAKFLSFGPLRYLSLRESIEVFADLMTQQLDLRVESDSLKQFSINFKNDLYVKFPVPYDGWVSKNVLVESFEEGEPILEFSKRFKYDTEGLKKISKHGLESYLKMLFRHNFVHADLHPGNIFIRSRNKELIRDKITDNFELVFLDCGLTASLTKDNKANFVKLFKLVIEGNGYDLGKLMLQKAKIEKCKNHEAYCVEMDNLVSKYLSSGGALMNVPVGKILGGFLSCSCKHSVKLESNMVSVMIATIILEGLGRHLDPSLDVLMASKPFVLDAFRFLFF
eukprot:GHVL01027907.1.p1 GENE.GHVL01027907.1~~GHVL01027907.1.p1  ORF type:complete len:389 (+),score=51.24 GHVL01027907.1:255-1421(+)